MTTALVRRPSDVAVERLTLNTATELCQQNPKVGGQLLMALLAQNTEALPNTSFVRRQDGTYLKKLKMTVRLSESEGTLVSLGSKKVGDNWVRQYDLSISGYRRLNELPALQVIRPDTVIVNGQKQMNPYIQVDVETKMPEVVYARCFAVGYGPTGSLVATDVMVRLDINIYLLENIQSKLDRSSSDNERNKIGVYGVKDEPPVNENGEPMNGTYRFFPIHSVGGIGLWVNLQSRMIQTILKDHTTRLKFVERLAQSFSERNALKAHPAIPKVVNAENGVAYAKVTGWTHDFDRDDIRELQVLAEDDRLNEFKGGEIEVHARQVVNELDDGSREMLNEEAEREQAHDTKPEAEENAEVDPGDVDILGDAGTAYGNLLDLKGRRSANILLKKCGIENMEEAKAEQLKMFIDAVDEVIAKSGKDEPVKAEKAGGEE